jgi:hypothetical protein
MGLLRTLVVRLPPFFGRSKRENPSEKTAATVDIIAPLPTLSLPGSESRTCPLQGRDLDPPDGRSPSRQNKMDGGWRVEDGG